MDGNDQQQMQFYHEQNLQLRRVLRELDMRLATSKPGEEVPSVCSFIVLGPKGGGKSSLLR